MILGFLTGAENEAGKNAHVESVLAIGEPLAAVNGYDFSTNDLVKKIHSEMPAMVDNRLTPPPPEVYTIHRKLSGALLLCMKLKAHINAHQLFLDQVYVD